MSLGNPQQRRTRLGRLQARRLRIGPDAATIDLPGPNNVEVFTAHWSASQPSDRVLESANSEQIISNFNQMNPDAFYLYTGDFNVTDSSSLITDLLVSTVGLNLITPVDPNNGSSATINAERHSIAA